MDLKIGDKAPSFILKDSEMKDVELSSFSGQNVLILFFPLAFTSVCTAELCGTRDELSAYNDLNTTVLAISVDSPFALAKFKEENKLNFKMLSDFNKNDVSPVVFNNLISEAITMDDTKGFAVEVLSQIKSSSSFTILASNYDSNDNSEVSRSILEEINSYADLSSVSHLRSTLLSSDETVFETSLKVLKTSMDTHLNGRSISSDDGSLNAQDVFSSFLPVLSSLDRTFEDDNRLGIFDTILNSLQALFSNGMPQELTV